MKSLLIGMALLGVAIGLPVLASTVQETRPVQQSSEKATDSRQTAHHTHRHRHCHIGLSLGHMRRKCHTHHHNPIVHHGLQFH